MYKEVAFDPKCMADMVYYRLLKQHFGFEKGRYVSAQIKTWANEAMQVVKDSNLKTIEEQSIKNYLNKIVRSKKDRYAFILPTDRQKINAGDWDKWLEAQTAQRDFSLVVSNKAIEGSIDIDQIDDGNEDWEIPASLDVLRKAEDITNALHPMMSISKSLTLIDPYFRLTQNRTLERLIVSENCNNLEQITIVTAMKAPNALSIFQREYQSLKKPTLQLKWLEMPEKLFHERYAITDIGAVRSGPGFMESTIKGANSDFAPFNLISIHEANRALCDLSRLMEENKAVEIFAV